MLVSPLDLYKKAKKGGYAVGAFNTCSIEITKAIIAAAEELKAPVVIETSPGEADFLGSEIAVAEVKILAKKAKVPIALHLDHGKSVPMVEEVIKAGYTSVHIDASALEFEKNVALTKKVVTLAHEKGITVEGEIGHVAGTSQLHQKELVIDEDTLTDPDEAASFVKKTKVDVLAVAIGNIHGVYKNPPKLDFKRFEEIVAKTCILYSLHGGSGIPKNQVKKAISLGIVKVNVNTELRMAFKEGILHEFEVHPEEVVPYKYLPAGTEAVKKAVENKIRLFGSAGKA